MVDPNPVSAQRIPLIPTAIVALAVAVMIALGLWQLLDRGPKKQAYLAQLAANPSKPEMAFPRLPDDSLLFRRASLFCMRVTGIRLEGAGAAGYRAIAGCTTGVEGPEVQVQLGTTRDPQAKPAWKGGEVSGYITHAPEGRSMLTAVIDPVPPQLMLVAAAPPAGLAANTPPNVDSIPNNHLAYAVQWFLFAGIAAVIYVLALRYRGRPVKPVPDNRQKPPEG